MATFLQRLFGFGGVRTRRSLPLRRGTSRFAILSLERLEDRLAPATLTVNSSADTVSGTAATLDLREAILLVNSSGTATDSSGNSLSAAKASQISGTFGVADTIQFASGLNGKIIALSGTELPAISKNETITGLGASNLAISGNSQSGVFTIVAGAQVSISDLTIQGGNASNGGGINNAGTLTVTGCTLSGNSATSTGGGIYNNGTLAVINCTLSDNSATADGGINNLGTLRVSDSTLAENSTSGGGLGGGIGNQSTGFATLNNTIVADNTSGGDLDGNGFSGAYDLIGDGSDLGSFSNSLQGNPLLAPLGNYGGPTQTLALLPGSPAIDAGSSSLAVDANGNPLSTDQRGQPRILGSSVDIGAYESQGLEGTSTNTVYALSNGNLTISSTHQVIASNVTSFAQNSQGELCYLQNNGQLWFYGDSTPVARGVARFAIDADGAVIYLGLNGVLSALTVPQPLDNSTPIVLFKMDGAATAVVLDQQGNLLRFAPGAASAATLDSTVTTNLMATFTSGSTTLTVVGSTAGLIVGDLVTGPGIAPGTTIAAISGSILTVSTSTTVASTGGAAGESLTATASVVTFAVDGSGGVVELNSDGNLLRYAPGSNTAELLDTKVSKFAIDGAGSIVALENSGATSVPLANGQVYSTPAYNLVGFVSGSSGGSLTKDVMDTGVTTMLLDGAGSVVALDSLANSSITLANGQVFSTPSYSMVRFAPGSTVKLSMDTGVTHVATDGAGSVVALDSLSQSPSAPLSDGESFSSPVYTMVEYGPNSTTRNVLDSGVGRFAVDGAGAGVALDNFSSGSNGVPYWSIASFAAPSYSRDLLDSAAVSSFVIDGSGTVVALDSGLVRLFAGPALGGFTRHPLTYTPAGGTAEAVGTGPLVVDASGAVFTLSGTNLIRFAPGSDQGSVVADNVSKIAVDSSGSVVALNSPTTETLAGSEETATVYNLIRFAPGATTPTVLDSGVSQFVVDSSGAVVAKDSLIAGPNGPIGLLRLFAPGSSIPQTMAPIAPGQTAGAPVSSFTVDGSGSIVALLDPTSTDTYTLVRFAPGSTSPQQLDTNVGSFVLDGTGAVVAMREGTLERFAVGSATAVPMPLNGTITSYVVDGSGTVFAVVNQELWSFSIGSTTSQQVAGGSGNTSGKFAGIVNQIAVDGVGDVVALVSGDLVRFTAGGASAQPLLTSVQQFVVDGTGSVYALVGGKIYVFAPGANQPSTNAHFTFDGLSDLIVDASGTVVAFDASAQALVQFYTDSYGYEGFVWNPSFPYVDFVAKIGVDASGCIIALERQSEGGPYSLIRFAPGLSTYSVLIATNVVTFFERSSGDIIAACALSQQSAASGYELIEFAPGATQGIPVVDAKGNVLYTSNFAGDASGAIFVASAGSDTFTNGSSAPTMVYSLLRVAPGALVPEPVLEPNGAPFENVSNLSSDGSGSVVALDALSQTLYRFVTPGSTTAVPINYNGENVTAFVVDGAGYVWAMESSEQTGAGVISYADTTVRGSLTSFLSQIKVGELIGNATSGYFEVTAIASDTLLTIASAPGTLGLGPSFNIQDNTLIQYAPGSKTGILIDRPIQSFAIQNGKVVALEVNSTDSATGAEVGNIVQFAAGSQTRQVVEPYEVSQMVLLGNGEIVALEMPNLTLSYGNLVLIEGGASILLDPAPVSSFFVDRFGTVIGVDLIQDEFDNVIQNLVSYNLGLSGLAPPNVMVGGLQQLSILPDGTILALDPEGELFVYPPGDYNSRLNMVSIADNLRSFSVARNVRNFAEWQAQEGSELTANPSGPTFWQVLAQEVEIMGAVVLTVYTGGAASPLVALAVGAGEALANQTINHFAFGSSFNLGAIGLAALTSVVGGNTGILDSLDELGGDVGGVVGDVTDALDEAAGEISQTVGDLVRNVIDPNSFVGKALGASFNKALDTFLKTGSLGAAANAGLSSLEGSALTGALNSGFAQDTLSFLNDVAAKGEDAVQDGLDVLSEIGADGLSGGAFGQTAASFLVNAVQNGLTGKPIFQNSLSFLGQVVSDGLGDSPFAQEAAQLVNQAVTNGVNGNLANSLLSFVGQTAANELANSSFVQDGLSFVNQALADGLGSSSLLLDGANFLENAVANGLAGSSFSQQLGSFLQGVGVDGLTSLSSTLSGEIDTFLQDIQNGTTFINSTLGSDASAFWQQAAQGGLDVLNSNFVTDAGALLDTAVQQIGSLSPTVQSNLGSFLEDAAADGTAFVNSGLGESIGTFLNTAVQDGSSFLNSNFMAAASSVLDDAAQQISTLSPGVQNALGLLLQDAANGGTNFLNSTLGGDVTNFLNSAAQAGAGFVNSNFMQGASTALDVATLQSSSLSSTVQANLNSFLQDAAQAGTSFANSSLGAAAGTFLNAAATDGVPFLNSGLFSSASAVLDEAAQQIGSIGAGVQTNLGAFLDSAASAGTSFLSTTLASDAASFLNTAAQDGVSFVNSSLFSGSNSLLQQATQQLSNVGATAQTSIGNFLQQAAQAGIGFANSTLGTDAGSFLSTAGQDGSAFLNSGLMSGADAVLGVAAQQINSLAAGVQTSLGSFLQDAAKAGAAFSSSALGNDVSSFLSTAAQDGVNFLNSNLLVGASALLDQGAQQINSVSYTAQTSVGNFLQAAAQAGMGFATSTLGTDAGSFLSTAAQDGVNFFSSGLFSGAMTVLQEAAPQINSLGTLAQTNLGSFLDNAATAGTTFLNSTLGGAAANFLNIAAQDGISFVNSSFVSAADDLLGGVAQQVASLGSTVQTNLGGFLQTAGTLGNAFVNSTLGSDAASFLTSATQDGVNFLNTTFVSGTSSFLQQAAQDGTGFLNGNGAALGAFLDQAAQAGLSFASSTLGTDAGAFLQQAAQDGVDFLNLAFTAGAAAFLQQETHAGASFLNGNGAALGAFLQQAAQTGFSFASSGLGSEAGAFLEQAAQDGANFLTTNFVSGAAAFLQQAAQAGTAFFNGNGAALGAFLQQAAQSGAWFASSTVGGEVGSFLSQAGLDGTAFLNSTFVAGAASFLNQTASSPSLDGSTFAVNTVNFFTAVAGAPSLVNSTFAPGAVSLLNQFVAAGVTNTPFAQGAALALQQTVADNLGTTIDSQVLSFLENVTSAGLTGSTFAQQSIASLNQTLSGGSTSGPAVQSLLASLQSGLPQVPLVTTDPTNLTVTAGQQATFTAAASGTPTPSVQWQVSSDGIHFSNIAGATSATYAFTANQLQNHFQYQAVFTNVGGNAVTTPATLTVQTAPIVTTQPASQAITAGQQVTFTAAASGTPTPTVQWEVSTDGVHFSNIAGATNSSYSFIASQAQIGEKFEAVFTNAVGSATSNPATLTVQSAPVVTLQPVSQTIVAGLQVTFTAAASGSPTPSVQWQVSSDGVHFSNIPGATGTSYSFLATEAQNGEVFQAVFTNSAGNATTMPATLTVSPVGVVSSFNAGEEPYDGVIVDSNGNLFGTTRWGGDYNDGTIFEVAQGSGTNTTLASFSGANGVEPIGGLIMDSNGNLYGTAKSGGPDGDGTVFELAKGSRTINPLAYFDGKTNGSGPIGGVVMDANRNLYGITSGTIFELAFGSGAITTLASLSGVYPAGLAIDSSGNLYGTTQFGGTSNDGTVFELVKGSSTVTTLASFDGTNGGDPIAGVVVDSSGNLYGTTDEGGAIGSTVSGDGTIFELANGSSTITTLATFDGDLGGAYPETRLIIDNNGNLYGTARAGGGPNGADGGTVYELAKGSNTITELATFGATWPAVAAPDGNLSMDSKGNLYGTTWQGAAGGDGTVFEVVTGSGTVTTLALFNDITNGANPDSGLIMDSSGNLYGTTIEGGALQDGTIYEISKGSSTITTLASLFYSDVQDPLGSLIMDSSGDLFGLASEGGAYGDGAIFELVKGSAYLTQLASFNGTDGRYPLGNLLMDGSGNLYGTTAYGGTNNNGTVFELAKGSASIKTLWSFGAGDGVTPQAGLVMDGSGNLYGTTEGGGTSGDGTVFELSNSGSTFTTLASFNGTEGKYPFAGLVIDSSGNLYGTTWKGGADNDGTVFEVVKGSSTITLLASFTGANGANPEAALTLDSSGNLYGTTSGGGASGGGTVFELSQATDTIVTLASFSGPYGQTPIGGLIWDGNGNLLGTASTGGAYGFGDVFEIHPAPLIITQSVSQTATDRQQVTFSAGAIGTPTPTVQWQVSTDGVNFSNIPGATGLTYTLTASVAENGEEFRAVFTNPAGTVTTNPATLSVPLVAPTVTAQPVSQTVTAGQQATFTATAAGTPFPTVYWQYSADNGSTWTSIAGATSTTYTFTASQSQSGEEFEAVFTNSQGSATSGPATLTVQMPPAVTTQPASQTITAGQPVTFTAAASGVPAPSVQWQVSTDGVHFSNIPGATGGSYSFTTSQSESGEQFQAVFSNGAGSVTSKPATLTVQTAPAVTTQPASQTVTAGQQATFTAAASGTPTPSVQWQVSSDGVNFSNIAGATSDSYTFTPNQGQSGEQFQAVFTNAAGSATSMPATLTMQTLPVVTIQPVSQAISVGQLVTFTAAANGTPPPAVQWQVSTDGVNFSNIAGATATTYSFTVNASQSGQQFRAVFTNAAGSATSAPATLTLQRAPVVGTQPTSQTITAGQQVTFTAAASGTPTPSVQWQVSTDGVNFSNIANAVGDSYTFTTSQSDSGEQFQAVFTNAAGSATSNPATLTVQTPPAVTRQPASQTITAGQQVTFMAAASGAPAPSVQWQVSTDGVNFSNIPGATGGSYIFTASQVQSGEQFQAVFTNALGSVTSQPATLTVQTAPAVTTQPASQTVTAGQQATFTAAASGTPTPSVQWQVSTDGVNFSNIPGATSDTYSFTANPTQEGEQFQAVFTNAAGSVTSQAATLTVPTAPAVTTEPASQTITAGQQVTFTAAASGTPAPAVQWQMSSDGVTFNNIPGATGGSYSFTTSQAQSGEQFQAVFTNALGSAISTPAKLTVQTAPIVTTQPASQTITFGQQVTFTAAASGTPTPAVQWQMSSDGVHFTAIPGATSNSYSFTVSQWLNGEQFQAVFTNPAGSVASNLATLTLQSAPVVLTQPISQTVLAGQQANLTVALAGTPIPSVQWEVSTDGGTTFQPIAGATSSSYSFTAGIAQNGNEYEAVLTNAAGSATSNPTTLIVQSVPTLTVSDAGGTYNGNPFSASATAVGIDGTTPVAGSFTFAYYVGTSASGTPSATAPTNTGTYTVVATFTSSDSNYSSGGTAQTTFTIRKGKLAISSTADDGSLGTLRYAINSADAGNLTEIDFAIGAVGSAQTIYLTSALPTLTANGVSINGLSQGGSGNTKQLITLDGTNAGSSSDGLLLQGTNCIVSGLLLEHFNNGIEIAGSNNIIGGTTLGAGNVISANTTDGVRIDSGISGVQVLGNYIGTDVTGTKALANSLGIQDLGDYNTLGGTTAGARNLISGNSNDGILLNSTTTNETVEGNYIGVDVSGKTILANGRTGVEVQGTNNTIGGNSSSSYFTRNFISGNAIDGVALDGAATGNVVQGNFIGLDISGTIAAGNVLYGIQIGGSSNTIGGTTAGFGNVISGNEHDGIVLNSTASSNAIQGNDLGTDYTGKNAVANSAHGIEILGAGNTLGGTVSGARNIISGNAKDGVLLDSSASGTLIEGNYVGINLFSVALPNASNGIEIASIQNTIGGTASAARNIISGNTNDGVLLDSGVSGNQVLGNYIGTNNTGNAALANKVGIEDAGNKNTIGGTVSGARNILSGNSGDGVLIDSGASGNLVSGNILGLTAGGSTALANSGNGVNIQGTNNTIGGTLYFSRNFISGNSKDGVLLGSSASGNQLLDNFIGLELSGTHGVGNRNGVEIAGSSNTIGSTASGGINFISANSSDGVLIDPTAKSNLVQSNDVGTDYTGQKAVANSIGIEVAGAGNTLGGTASAARNIVAGNSSDGVRLDSTGSGTVLLGNSIGVNAVDAALANGANGLNVLSTSNTIGGTASGARNIISGNANDGVLFASGASGNQVLNNFIGVDLTGSTALANSANGIEIAGSGNTIGGTASAARNQISGNTNDGVLLDSAASGNQVLGNYIGINHTGNGAVANKVGIEDAGTSNTIGGSVNGARNFISGNTGDGVLIDIGASSDQIQGNFLGLNPSGNAALANGSNGVEIQGTKTTVGGTVLAARNYICGNSNAGLLLDSSASGNLAVDNFIGVDVSGTHGVGNVNYGISLAGSNNSIGGTSAAYTNVISGSSKDGLLLAATATGNLIQGNDVGTDYSGQKSVANSIGIEVAGAGNTLGGTASGARNIVAGNSSDGVKLDSTGSGTVLLGNLIGINAINVALANSGNGLDVLSINDTVGGTASGARNVLSGNSKDGLLIASGASGNQVLGNFIGVNIYRTAALANGSNGIEIAGNGNTIGGTATAALNIISGNSGDGVKIDSGASGNQVLGNYIGTNAGANGALANGIGVEDAGSSNTIGSSVSGARNIISGNTGDGILLDSTATGDAVWGNFLGLNVTGNGALGNGKNGLEVQGAKNTVGGTLLAERNYITGNTNDGLLISSSASGNLVLDNFIGIDQSGTHGVANLNGVEIAGTGNTIGGTVAGSTNVISANKSDGILIDSTGSSNLFLHNDVGTDYTGKNPVANSGNGIEIASNNNTVGGSVSGAGNIISGNSKNGVLVSAGSGDTISRNSIFANAGLGISLGSGANNNIAAPALSSATLSSSTLTVTGSFTAPIANVSYVLEFFANPSGDAEGRIYLGSLTVTPPSSGTQNFTFSTTTTVPRTYPLITATLTDNSGDTSQFSYGVSSTTIYVVTNAADSGSGTLRDAITQANNTTSGITTIGFAIGTSGSAQTISLTSALPALTANNVFINGLSQGGLGNITPLITLDGTKAGSSSDGVLLQGSSNVVSGLIIENFGNNAIEVAGAGNTLGGNATGQGNVLSGNTNDGLKIDSGANDNQVLGNFIGINPAGTAALANSGNGIEITSNGNTIGGTATAARNIISGNTNDGVLLDSGASGNVIEGDYIGTDVTGTVLCSNNSSAIDVQSADNTIGGAVAGARNVIAGSGYAGIRINGTSATGNMVLGNYVGLNAAGTAKLGALAQDVGLEDGASSNMIGTSGSSNVLAGAVYNGISVYNDNTNSNVIADNYIGTDATGRVALGNRGSGIGFGYMNSNLGASNTQITDNVISGNGTGISIDSASHNTRIAGNSIGTNAAGTAALANSGNGVEIQGTNNTIGGSVYNARNFISGNTSAGVLLGSSASGNVVVGNFIGPALSGTQGISNLNGIEIAGNGNTIGGTASGSTNVLSANKNDGILLDTTASGNLVLGNDVGTDYTGKNGGLANSGNGIEVAGVGNTLGGTTTAARNIISGNSNVGVLLDSTASGNVVLGNYIGVNLSGTALANSGNGIEIAGNKNTVGGSASGAGNIISGNSKNGVLVSAGSGDTISRNSIYANGALGISLASGANNTIAAPTLTTATLSGSTLTVTGNFTAPTANVSYVLEFFANPSGDAEGKIYLGSLTVTPTSTGTQNFTFTATTTVTGTSPLITATLTDGSGDTSSFCNGVTTS